MTRRPSFYALALLLGALLVLGAGLRHPPLVGDGAAHLATVAGTAAWRSIHLALIFGIVLLVAGLIGVTLRHGETPGAGAARAGVLLAVLGYGVALIQILFMAGAAPALADVYARGEPGLAATQAVLLYDVLHPFATMAGRAGQFAVGLAVWSYGWAITDGKVFPRWLGYAGVAAGAVAVLAAVVLHEANPRLMAGVALVTVWQFVVGGWMVAQEGGLTRRAAV